MLPVVGMAIAVEAQAGECGWLAGRWRGTVWVWRLVRVVGLAIINAASVFAQLVAANVQRARIRPGLGQIDCTIEEDRQGGRTNAAVSAVAEQRKVRETLVTQRQCPFLRVVEDVLASGSC